MVFGVLLAVVCWLVFIPIGFALATPAVLLTVLCRRDGTFKGNVTDEYRRLWKFWKEWGILMVPLW
jgi:hypothetical protein